MNVKEPIKYVSENKLKKAKKYGDHSDYEIVNLNAFYEKSKKVRIT